MTSVLAGAGWAAGTGYGTIHQDWRYVEVAVVLCLLLGVFLARQVLARARRS
jgi:membrane protein DedA with SNARE-associated domain